MKVYAGIDLHANSSCLGVVDAQGKRIFRKKVDNDPELILGAFDSVRDDVAGIVVESTFNWYWLVDLLMDEGYRVHLANPAAIQKYTGLKHSDDTHDAFWLAEMLRLGVLPTGYIYPKEQRPVRDLLRKRGHLVRIRTSLILSLQGIVARNRGRKLKGNDIRSLSEDRVSIHFEGDEDLALAGRVSKEAIDDMTRKILAIEKYIEGRMEIREDYRQLHTMPGVGKILALTIALETGEIGRFAKVGNYSSYCRKVPSRWTSNGKSKGRGNTKNGNKYLAWAFSEAAELARRFHPEVQAYYNRKLQETSRMIAHTALAHKLARAAYYIMKDRVPFDPAKLFT
jgi:transposase